MEKKKVINAFNCTFTAKGKDNFDKDYIDRVVVPYIEKVGPNDTDFIVRHRVIDKKKPIKEVVNAEKDQVGVYNVLRQLAREHGQEAVNDYIKNGPKFDDINAAPVMDISDMPTTLAEAFDKQKELDAIYAELPKDLKKGMSVSEFFKKVKPEDIQKYYSDKAKEIYNKDPNILKKKFAQEEIKPEVKVEGDKK